MAMDGSGEGSLPPSVEHHDGEQRSNLNISDVFEAISNADPSFQPQPPAPVPVPAPAHEPEPAVTELQEMYPVPPPASAVTPPQPNAPNEQKPYVHIVEQPASKALRFRYECEGRSAGSIPGAHSTPENKTYPTIEIVGHKGRAVVVVSCVTKDKPYRPHPHNLVGRDLCKNGVCTVNVHPDNMVVSFSNLGIQCVKKKDIEEALRERERIRVDPFRTGFAHKSQAQGIDLNAVRLCFQVFVEYGGRIRHALQPVVSDIIYDKKAMNDLVITRLSHCSAPVCGGKQLILLCEKVAKEDIAVTFFEKVGGQVTWQADAVDLFVHKQVAICFTTPRYPTIHVTDHVQVYIQLRRPTDNERSDALPFELIPMTSADPNYLKRKRQKPLSDFSEYAQPEHELNQHIPDYYDLMGMARDQKIKLEPRDKTPPHALSSPPAPAPLGLYRALGGGGTPSPPHLTHLDQYQWSPHLDNLAVPGPSHLGAPYSPQDMNWAPTMGHVSPSLGHMSPNMNQMTPNMGHVSPNMNQMTPNMGHVSPNMNQMAPNMGHVSPNMNQMTPNMGHVSPNMNQMAPNMGHVSPNMSQMAPNMGHVSPNLVQQSTNLTQLTESTPMESSNSDSASITRLLQDRGDTILQLNSTDLSGLSTFLDKMPDQLSDSLNRLSTSDLLPRTQL